MPVYILTCQKCNYTEEKYVPKIDGHIDYACPVCQMKEWKKKPTSGFWTWGDVIRRKT